VFLAQRRKASKEKGVDAAVAAGLDWLRRHASQGGGWDCDAFAGRCVGGTCGGPGSRLFDPGVTGLAALAFLGAGRTHGDGPDADLLRGALKSLRDAQDREGCVGARTSDRFMYCHAAATMALAEAYWLTGDAALREPAQRAVSFVHAAQNPYLGWRYGVRDGDNDTSVTVWCTLALRTADFARLDVDRTAYASARAWFELKSGEQDGRVGYQRRGGLDARAWRVAPDPVDEPVPTPEPPPAPSPPDPGRDRTPIPRRPPLLVPHRGILSDAREAPGSRTAPRATYERYPDDRWSALSAGAAAAVALTGAKDAAKDVDRWAALVVSAPPADARFLDLHYLLFGSLLHAQRPLKGKVQEAGTPRAPSWRDVAVGRLTSEQRPKADACAAGSWDPELDPFGFAGGRVYSTATAVLALQAPNRFPKVGALGR
jgi:hypothetical protein